MALIRTQGLRKGLCNICGIYGKLTEDHIPPKGTIHVSAVELREIVERLRPSDAKLRAPISQNGVKYRTLCAQCNNLLLGHRYDSALIAFSNEVGNYLTSNIVLPDVTKLSVQPQKVMRSVIGHLSAQGVGRFGKGKYTHEIMGYLIDSDSLLPESLRVYCWVYPHKTQVLIRAAALRNLKTHQGVAFWLLKFFPLAFFVTFD